MKCKCCNCLTEIEITIHQPRICFDCETSIRDAMAKFWFDKYERENLSQMQ